MALATVVLTACGPSSEVVAQFLAETKSIAWTEEERLDSGNKVCNYLNQYRQDFQGESYSFAFDDLYRFAINAGATVSQALDLNGASVRHLCDYEPYTEAFESWLKTVNLDVLLND